MEKEIKVPDFLDYTDCRPHTEEKKISKIEAESIRTYAKNLSQSELLIFLEVVPSEVLLGAIGTRLYLAENKLQQLRKHIEKEGE